jgi:hypothetical protein
LNPRDVEPGSRPWLCTGSATLRPIPTGCDAACGGANYQHALALAEPRGKLPLVAHCHLGLARLYHRTGKREQAQEHLASATTMYREMGITYWLEKARSK